MDNSEGVDVTQGAEKISKTLARLLHAQCILAKKLGQLQWYEGENEDEMTTDLIECLQ